MLFGYNILEHLYCAQLNQFYNFFYVFLKEICDIFLLISFQVPIVKLTDNLTNVKVDISFNMTTGTDCANLIEVNLVVFVCVQGGPSKML